MGGMLVDYEDAVRRQRNDIHQGKLLKSHFPADSQRLAGTLAPRASLLLISLATADAMCDCRASKL